MTPTTSALFPGIEAIFRHLDTAAITNQRKEVLQPLIDFIQAKATLEQPVRLHFICTHNSRRSHLAQVWAQTAAAYLDIKNLCCFSGGTQVTALFPIIAETLRNSGFKIKALSVGNNPVYSIKYAGNEHAIIAFSKVHDDDFNPKNSFAAIMTCSEADVGCPFIEGAEKRIAIPYEDPKAFDNTPQQAEQYQARSLQIATEMLYVFSQIKP